MRKKIVKILKIPFELILGIDTIFSFFILELSVVNQILKN